MRIGTIQAVSHYLGVGWDILFGKNKQFGFLIDLGVVYQGNPEVELSTTGDLANNAAFLNNLQNEEDIPVASGMYFAHVTTEFGNVILKIAVINRGAFFRNL